MAIYQNIQISNQRQQSKYPFDSSASLLLGKYTFPAHLIKSLCFQVTQCVFPVYISSIDAYGQQVTMTISDMTAKQLGRIILLSQRQGQVLDSYNCACGGISFQAPLYKWCIEFISTTRYKHISLISSQLPLASCVITCLYLKGYKGLSFSGTYKGPEVTLNFQRSAFPTITESTIRVDMWGDMSIVEQGQPPICLSVVNGVSMVQGSLTIKHKVLSDARVITSPNKITIKGVLDVSGNQ